MTVIRGTRREEWSHKLIYVGYVRSVYSLLLASRICFLPTLPLSAGECYFNDVVTVNFKHRLFSGVSLIVNYFFFS